MEGAADFHIGGKEVLVGLGLIAPALFLLATINVVTKRHAAISGIRFTLAFLLVFELSERSAWTPATN